MNTELLHIIDSKEFKEYLNHEFKYKPYEHKNGCLFLLFISIVFHTIVMSSLFSDELGILFIVLIYICSFPNSLVILFIIYFILSPFTDKIELKIRNRSKPYQRLQYLKKKCDPIEKKLISQIEDYIGNDSANLLEKTKDPHFATNAKQQFIDNYSQLNKLYVEFYPHNHLSNYLKESKLEIDGFYEAKAEFHSDSAQIPEENINKVKKYNSNEENSKLKLSPKIENIGKKLALSLKKMQKSSSSEDDFVLEPKLTKGRIVPVRNIDWKKLNNLKHDIGLVGEELALEYERSKFIRLGLYELVSKIEHVSKTKGDGLGYDILSFDAKSNPIYIEVKTTIGGKKNEIIFTNNELVQMKKLADSYSLYRVYSLDIKERTCQIEIFEGYTSIIEYFSFSTSTGLCCMNIL